VQIETLPPPSLFPEVCGKESGKKGEDGIREIREERNFGDIFIYDEKRNHLNKNYSDSV
jgi:hypothetical protein